MPSSDAMDDDGNGPEPTREVQLCVMLSPAGRNAVRAEAAQRGLTVRALVLEALRSAGVPGLDHEPGGDRRAAVATLKAKVWRDYRDNASG